MLFENRTDAGKQLAEQLVSWKGKPDTVIIALPRGGIPVAYEVARALSLPLDITFPKKIGAPGNPEFAIGAVTESGEPILSPWIEEMDIDPEFLQMAIDEARQAAQVKLAKYRPLFPKQDLEGKTILLIDDGIATGMTMEAAIRSLRAEGADKIIVAVPVAPPDSIKNILKIADEVRVLSTPPYFSAVGQFYSNFAQVEDNDIKNLFNK